jgi:hypothetical protein
MKALPKILFALTAVGALSLAYPASVQAVPTTYQYTGNHFTFATGSYTTSDFVSGMVTLAGPLPPNLTLTAVFPTAFTFSDGVQTFTAPTSATFLFATGPTGAIVDWSIIIGADPSFRITTNIFSDQGTVLDSTGFNSNNPGAWVNVTSVPDTGSSLSLMTLTLMALGVAAALGRKLGCKGGTS